MLFDFSAHDIRNQHAPVGIPDWLVVRANTVEVSGDPVSYRETFVWSSDNRVLIATRPEEILARLNIDTASPKAAPFSISQMLNYGVVPMPRTAYERLQRLGPGDTLSFRVVQDRIQSDFVYAYPWLSALSREDQIPSASRLGELIETSVDKQLAAVGGSGMLMLSSGKDSVALALALANGGHTDVPCMTIKADPEDNEHVYAAELCKRLGLDHRTVALPEDQNIVRAALTYFFEHSPLPSVDHATIPYAVAVNSSGYDRGGIIDGCGNDGYMGFVPMGRRRLKSTFRVRNRRLASMIRNQVPHDSPVNYFTRSRVGTLFQRRMFRHTETQNFYTDAIETEDYWYQMSDDLNALELTDLYSATEVRLRDTGVSNAKVYLVAHAHGVEPVLPFCDQPLADYYFNLPQSDRLDRSSRNNKILLRQLLKEALDYDPAVVGSNHFQFDSATFIQNNEAFVRDEILSCDLWSPRLERDLNIWLGELSKRPFLSHSLVGLFMISGWHNHYPFINRKQG